MNNIRHLHAMCVCVCAVFYGGGRRTTKNMEKKKKGRNFMFVRIVPLLQVFSKNLCYSYHVVAEIMQCTPDFLLFGFISIFFLVVNITFFLNILELFCMF